jgi:uncharacterized membrane protein YedE/YeeE
MLGRYYACSVVGWVYALGLVVAAMSTYHCYYWKLRPVLISPLLIAGFSHDKEGSTLGASTKSYFFP